jgi:hypothetical protein
MSANLAIKSASVEKEVLKKTQTRRLITIEILEETNFSTLKESKGRWVYDNSIKTGSQFQADIDILNNRNPFRLKTEFNQVWSTSWKKFETGNRLFALIFVDGTNSKFDNVFLNQTKKNIVQFFENEAKQNPPKGINYIT